MLVRIGQRIGGEAFGFVRLRTGLGVQGHQVCRQVAAKRFCSSKPEANSAERPSAGFFRTVAGFVTKAPAAALLVGAGAVSFTAASRPVPAHVRSLTADGSEQDDWRKTWEALVAFDRLGDRMERSVSSTVEEGGTPLMRPMSPRQDHSTVRQSSPRDDSMLGMRALGEWAQLAFKSPMQQRSQGEVQQCSKPPDTIALSTPRQREEFEDFTKAFMEYYKLGKR